MTIGAQGAGVIGLIDLEGARSQRQTPHHRERDECHAREAREGSKLMRHEAPASHKQCSGL